MMREKLRKLLVQAMKEKDEQAKNLLRLVLGELDTADARQGPAANEQADDQRISGIVKKLIESNAQTLDQLGRPPGYHDPRGKQLIAENLYLKTLLPPTLSEEELVPLLKEVAEGIKSAKSEGQATGVAMKHLKAKGVMNADSLMVIAIVKELRG